MALFGKRQPGAEKTVDPAEALRRREQMVARREGEAMRREKAILERQLQLEKQARELTRREQQLGQGQGASNGSQMSIGPGASSLNVTKAGLSSMNGPRSATGAGSQQAAPSPAPAPAPSGPSLEEIEKRLSELERKEKSIKKESARLEEWNEELDRQSADLAVREAKVAMAERQAAERAQAVPDLTAGHGSGHGSGENLVALNQMQATRIHELEQQLSQLRAQAATQASDSALKAAPNFDLEDQTAALQQREQQLQAQAAELEEQKQALERRQDELRKGQADLYKTQEMLENRQLELDKREVELMALQTELREAQEKLEKRERALARGDAEVSMMNISVEEDLPEYASAMSVLKADQIKLQERVVAGLSTHAEDVVTNVLF